MKLSVVASQAALDSQKPLLANGTCVLYSGTAPANPDAAITSQVALVTYTFSATPFSADSLVGSTEQSTGTFVASTVLPTADGTVGWARCWKADGTTAVWDLVVGATAGAGIDAVLGNLTVVTTNAVGPITFTSSEPVH